jgi:RNA polymerase primary sigma factor
MDADDPVIVYLNEMNKVPPMTREQQVECVRHIRARDELAEIAVKDLTETALPLVVAIAQKYPSDRSYILDLVIAGNNALLAAVPASAESHSEDLRAFVAPFIERAIKEAISSAI